MSRRPPPRPAAPRRSQKEMRRLSSDSSAIAPRERTSKPSRTRSDSGPSAVRRCGAQRPSM
eukprot:1259408-Pyramimonas_sp.AAC.1